MAGEKSVIFSSNVKYVGVFNFRNLYSFMYDWLEQETQLDFIMEEKYEEKIKGPEKDVIIKWTGDKKLTDYFKYTFKMEIVIRQLKNVEINQDGKKIKTNEGSVQLKVKGILHRDYEGKFEKSGFLKFIRSVYEKWIISSRVDEMEGKLSGDCDEFLAQAKAYLDIEGRK
jgi:hypothetical protein